MRKVLVIALGLASVSALSGVQPAFAGAGQACVQIALQQCNLSGGQCTTGNQYLALYRQCLQDLAGMKATVADLKQQQRAANLGPGVTARNIAAPGSGSTTHHNR